MCSMGFPRSWLRLPRTPNHVSVEPLLAAIRAILDRETSRAWGVRKVWATLRREGTRTSRRRVHAVMRAHGLVLARDYEPGEPLRGHVVVPEPNRRIATDLTTVWTRRDGTVALVPTIDCGDRTTVVVVTKDQHGPAVLSSVELKLRESFGAPSPVTSSSALTMARSTPVPTATTSASAGTSTTPLRRSEGPRATPSRSASSAR